MEKLSTHYVEKPWGRTDIPAIFPNPGHRQIGEIWFQSKQQDSLPLLIKYLFTSERLSIQVHPSDAQARAAGEPSGKEEIWYIIDCEPDAKLGIGLTKKMSAQETREAALDGSLEHLIDWKPVKPGDCYFIPAGTIHAIGAGITLAEIQQNADITYRLFDYGRPRDLHLDAGIEVSRTEPYTRKITQASMGEDKRIIGIDEAPFWLELVSWEKDEDVKLPACKGPLWFIPLQGHGRIDGKDWTKGECWLLDCSEKFEIAETTAALIAGT